MSLNRSDNDDDNDNKTKGFSWMEDGKTLSKNLLYTPLVAYLQQQGTTTPDKDGGGRDSVGNNKSQQYDPSQYMQQLSRVPKSLHEASFVTFMQFVSHDYHRHRATFADAKNNGSRPVSVSDMDSRIRQRGITLIGGGITSVPPMMNADKARAQPSKRLRRPRQRPWEKVQSTIQSAVWNNTTVDSKGGDTDDAIQRYLLRLNETWNDYAARILNLPTSDGDGVRTGGNGNLVDIVSTTFDSLRKSGLLELTGAHIRIDQCKAHPGWVERFGVVIGETTNTWRVAGYRKRKRPERPSKKIKCESIGDNHRDDLVMGRQISLQERGEPNSDHKVYDLDWYFVPKVGSSLMIIIPIPSSDATSVYRPSSSTNDDNLSQTEGRRLTIIPLPEEAICVVLDT